MLRIIVDWSIVRVIGQVAAEKHEIHIKRIKCGCSGMGRHLSTSEIVAIEDRKWNMHGGCHHAGHDHPVKPDHFECILA